MLSAIWTWADADGDGALSRAEADRLREALSGSAFSDAAWSEACDAVGVGPAGDGWTSAQFAAAFGSIFRQVQQEYVALAAAAPEGFTPVPAGEVTASSARRILVTGGNAGIGLALCKQLLVENGCYVYLCSRSVEKGRAAVASILEGAAEDCQSRLELVQLDVSSDESVAAAAATVQESLAGAKLYGLVNNAGTGLAHRVPGEEVVATNLYGVKRVCEAFIPLLDASGGRIVNVGSGAGPKYVETCDEATTALLTSPTTTWEQVEEILSAEFGKQRVNAYGVSKACLSVYSMILANAFPALTVSTISPGFIDTAIVKGFGATKPPEEGTVSIRHCLFEELAGNGWYYGSDALRSPLHYMRNPGEPPYTGPP